MLALENSCRLVTDFHSLWKQAQLATSSLLHVKLVEDEHHKAIFLRVVAVPNEDLSSAEILIHHVHVLLEASSVSHRQVKGALKLVRLFSQFLERAPGSTRQRESVVLNECTIAEMMLLEKLAEQDPRRHSLLQLGCECGCLGYVMGHVSADISLFRDLPDEFALVVLGQLIVQQNVPLLQKLMLDSSVQERVCTQFIENDVRDEALIGSLIDGLWTAFERNPEKRADVLRASTRLLEGGVAFLGRKIAEKVQTLRNVLNPMEEFRRGKTYADVFCSRGAVQADGFLAVFLMRHIDESSLEPVCIQFMKLGRVKELIPGAIRNQLPSCFNVIEAAIWLQVAPEQLSSILSCHEFELEIEKIRGKIPEDLLEGYLFSAWKVDRQHLKEVYFEPPSTTPQNIAVQQLIAQYESMVPASGTVLIDGRSCVIPKASLELFVGRIQRREFFIGTPRPNSPQLAEYYDVLELHICHTIALLQAKGDRESWLRCLQEYADAAGLCGGRYFATVMAEYFKASSQGNTPKEKILRSLAQFRRVWFEQTILNSPLDHNPNPLNRALHEYGVTYGIPGGSAAQHFDDPYGWLIPKGELETSFGKSYTADTMVQWLQEAAKEAEMKHALMEYYREHPPVGWRSELYRGIQKRIEEISTSSVPEQKKKELLQACFASFDIEFHDGKTPQASLLEAQQYDFLGHYFFDRENNIRSIALIHIVTDLKALSTPFHEVDFLWPEEKQKVEGLGELLQRVGSLVLSWFR